MVVELLFVLVVSMMTGYQAGKAGQKQEAIQDGGYCVLTTVESQTCYEVKKTEDPKTVTALKEKE